MAHSGLDFTKLSIEKRKLYVPENEDVIAAFSTKLRENFIHVTVKIIDCPDLTQQPFNLAASGLCGNECIFDIGGPPYLLPVPNFDRIYNLRSIINVTNDQETFIMGAGAGPWPYAKKNCEMIANAVIKTDGIKINSSRIIKVDNRENIKIEVLPENESRFCLMANIYSCRGEPGKVIQIHCKKRTGSLDFPAILREALASSFPDQVIGMGGIFVILDGKAKLHVMPDFSNLPLRSDEDLKNWLTFHEVAAPLINVGTFVSKDPEMDLRPQHFHCFGLSGGGHYHYDTTPNETEYLAYMSFGRTLYRIDRPIDSPGFGFD